MKSTTGEPGRYLDNGQKRRTGRSLGSAWCAAGMVLLALGTIGSALIGSWFWPWGRLPASWSSLLWWDLGGLVGAMALGAAIILASTRSPRVPTPGTSSDADNRLYSRYLTGLGFALLIVALSTAISAAGLVRNRWIEVSGAEFQAAFNRESPKKTALDAHANTGADVGRVLAPGTRVGLMLLLSTEMSILGALFFVTNRLRKKRDEPGGPEKFERGRFWSGMFFRMGEAVLFTFAFFWLFWKYVSSGGGADYTFLPILALFLGMFVKTGEQLMFGLGERLLLAVGQLFPIPASGSAGSPPAEGEERGSKGTRDDDGA
ncbi:MAG: hypothetical protein GXP48_07765 [Acidobacteria bacterium]|nr:hypothetical protein [Acidobacteriota bacterium]